jgi:hypothetical protein
VGTRKFGPAKRRRVIIESETMRPFPLRWIIRLIAFFSLLSLISNPTLAQGAAKGVAAKAGAPNFCVSAALVRAAGPLPGRNADCPAGFANLGGSCTRQAESRPAPSIAPDCPAGYKVDGATCERAVQTKPNPGVRPADCPDGYSNSGTACFRLSAAEPLPASRMSCKAGETKLDTRCFKSCEAGSASVGANCVRPLSTLGAEKMSCKAGYTKDSKNARCLAQCAAGFTNTGEACVRAAETLGVASLSCKAGETRQGGRCVATVVTCGKGEVLQGGTCYAACAPGYDGFGLACWPQPPKSWLACGTGAARDAESCAAVKLDPVALLRHRAVALGRDGNVAPAPGQQVMRLVALHAKFRELVAAYASVKDTAQFKQYLAAWTQANQGRDSFIPLDETGAPVTEPDMMKHALQLAMITGVAGATEGSAYPKCGA